MLRIVFAHGHLLRHDTKQFAIGKPYPPLATLIAAAYARQKGHHVALFDPMLDRDTSGFAGVLDREAPDLVVLYDDSFNWFTKMCLSRMRDAAFGMIAKAKARGARVIVSGHDAADDPEAYLRAGASYVILGEGELTLGELLVHLEGGGERDVLAIAGLALLHKGFLRRTPGRKLLQDLDVLPLPAWDLVEMERYRAFWRRRHGYFSLNVATTRGCPYLCNWCAKPTYGNTYHTRSPENVLAELRLLRETYAPDHLWFCDDILGLKSRWLVAWADAVARARDGTPTPFLCQTRADLMTEDNVAALAKAGAREVWLGAESGSQKILDAMQKGITVDETRAAVARLRKAKVRVGLFLQFGYHGEEWAEIQETRALLRELLPDDIGISVSYPLPGTGYYAKMAERLGEKRNWSESRDLDPLVEGARFSARFYRTLSQVVHAELRIARGAREVGSLLRTGEVRRDKLRKAAGLRHVGGWLMGRATLEMVRHTV